jgi:hypothetical protein
LKSFIKNMVAGKERIIGHTHVHWIYLAQGALWLIGLSIAGLRFSQWMNATVGPPLVPLYWMSRAGLPVTAETPLVPIIFVLLGLWAFGVFLFKYLGTEIALTSQRIIYKTGVIFVNTLEVDLVEIRSETVHHGFFGRFLGYGRIRLDSRFVGDTLLPAIPHPYGLLKALNGARTQVHDPMVDAVPGDASPHAAPDK